MYQEALVKRLNLVTETLQKNAVPFAIIGGNAVIHYVGQVDPGHIRSTSDIDLVMSEDGLSAAIKCLSEVGFRYRRAAGVHLLLDTPSAREGVHVIIAGRKVRPDYASVAPDVSEVELTPTGVPIIAFHKLVEMKLNSFRTKDRTHLLDMIEVGLLPGEVMNKLPEALRPRLQHLLDNPEPSLDL